jgi:hypothetical protein
VQKKKETMVDLSHEPDLGYIFYPHDISNHPGHPRLDVIIPAEPTFRHYDPVKVQFQVIPAAAELERLTIHHPWSLGHQYRVSAGRILITDRKGKKVEAFSFGGDLQVQNEQTRTICAHTSPAPIFPLFFPHALPSWFAVEAEVLLAERKADWDPLHPHNFEAHLTTVEPFHLYAGCLHALQEKVDAQLRKRDQMAGQGSYFVRAEIKRLKQAGMWPVPLVPLADLL